MAGSKYPIQIPSSTVFASPLLHDIDADGSLDVVVVTAEGLVYAFDLLDGVTIFKTIAVSPITQIDRKWLKETANSAAENEDRVFPNLSLKRMESGMESDGDYDKTDNSSSLTGRVLASPVIVDLNSDGRVEEMIVPVTYSDQG